MEISIADQIALDDALVAPADRLKIGKCNLRLSSDVTSKEATLQVVYDVLKLTPFYKAFQVTADAPEIYMQEFWASAYVHNRSVRFKMNNKKHILGLDQFRDILQICPKVGNKKFEEPPLEKEILAFLASLGHSGDIRKITDVNVNKLHQPWRSFAAIINKCLSGKPSYDSLRLSQAQILWGMYNKKNVDYAYLLWEDFIFQIENKNTKKGNAMYYPRFTKDDPMFTTINVISRNEDTQLYGAILPTELTNEDIRISESYKEYHAIASGKIPPKTKGSKKKADTDTTTKLKPPTIPKEKKEKTYGKGKAKLKNEGTWCYTRVPDALIRIGDDKLLESSDDDQDDEKAQDNEDEDKNDENEATQDDENDDVHDDDENAQNDDDEEHTESEDDGDDFIHPKLTTHDDEIIHEEETDEDDTFDPIVHTPSHISSSDDEDSDNDVEGTNVEGAKSDEDATYEEDQGNEAVEDTNTNLEGRDDVMTDVILPQVQATQEIEDTHVTLTPVNPDGQQQSSSVSSGFVSNMLNPNQDTGVDDIFEQHAEATSLIDTPVTAINLPNFASLFGFDYRLKSLEDNFSELRQINQYAEALSSIPGIVDQYMANKMQEAVDIAVQLKYDKIREESHTENQQFLDSIDEGMKKVIKEQVKKEVSKITPKIEKLVNEQLESEVLVRSSKEAKTSHAVAANLSEIELKKILIDKMEANNSINRSDIQKQLYQALVDAYEADKILLDTYGDTVTIKRPRDGADDDQEPSAGTDRGSKRRRSGKEPASTSAPRETTTTTAGKTTTTGSKTHKQSASQSAPVEETMQTTDVFEAPAHQEFETGVHDEQAEEEVQHLPDWFQQPTRLPSPDHAWNKSVPAVHESVQPWLSNLARRQDPRESFDELTDTTFDFSAFVMNRLNKSTKTLQKKLDWDQPEGANILMILRKPYRWFPNSQGRHVIPFHHFINNDLEYLCGGESSRKYSTLITKTKAADYGHIKLDRRLVAQFYVESSDKGDVHRLRGYKYIVRLLLLASARKVDKSQHETLSHQLRSRGFIYENKDKKNRLMRIDELHKFSDGTLDDVRTALNDCLKGIRMEYLPQTFWSQRDKANARYGYIRNYKKTVKNEQARTRESEEYKKKPKIQSRSQRVKPQSNPVKSCSTKVNKAQNIPFKTYFQKNPLNGPYAKWASPGYLSPKP
ncbi:hypothetical protein Tco_1555423 [Tanacetum coccineum]